MTDACIHVFEKAGLGLAPFALVGVEERRGPYRFTDASGITHEVGAPGQPMGTCAYCGQGIAICCSIVSADGKRFIVGSDCVAKTGDAGLKKQKRPFDREVRLLREDALIVEGQKVVEAHRAELDVLSYGGGTWAGHYDWMMRNAGNSGKLRVIRYIKKMLAGALPRYPVSSATTKGK